MSTPRTEAQKQAARENGKKSRGPVTESGKSRSRRNAVKHGLSNSQAQELPPDVHEAVEREVAVFEAQFKPRGEFEMRLVRTAAIASARLAQLSKAEMLHTQARVRRAVDNWDAARDDLVAQLVAMLDIDPAQAARGLLRFTEGCDWLADAWSSLAARLAENVAFDADDRTAAAHLLGHPALDASAADPRLRTLARLCDKLDAHEPEALTALEEFLRSQEHMCMERGDDLWERLDSRDRAGATELALFDPGPEYQRLMRYTAAAERTMRRALLQLAAARAATAPPPAPPRVSRPVSLTEPRRRSNEPGNTKTQAAIDFASDPLLRGDFDLLSAAELASIQAEYLPISITPGTR